MDADDLKGIGLEEDWDKAKNSKKQRKKKKKKKDDIFKKIYDADADQDEDGPKVKKR